MFRLEEDEFLNDSLIDFQLKYLHKKALFTGDDSIRKKAKDCYFFSSYFLTQLVAFGLLSKPVPQDDMNEKWKASFDKGFNSVKKWTKDVNIFEKKYLFIPVNTSVHWSVIIICNPGKIEMEPDVHRIVSDGDPSEDVGRNDVVDVEALEKDKKVSGMITTECNEESGDEIPAFVCMDSLKCHPLEKICKILRMYLQAEWVCQKKRGMKNANDAELEEDKGEESSCAGSGSKTCAAFQEGMRPAKMTKKNFPDIHPKVPTQENSCDCGVFLIKYAEWIFDYHIQSKQPAIRITRPSAEKKLKDFIKPSMFSLDDVGTKRDVMRRLIRDLQNNPDHYKDWGVNWKDEIEAQRKRALLDREEDNTNENAKGDREHTNTILQEDADDAEVGKQLELEMQARTDRVEAHIDKAQLDNKWTEEDSANENIKGGNTEGSIDKMAKQEVDDSELGKKRLKLQIQARAGSAQLMGRVQSGESVKRSRLISLKGRQRKSGTSTHDTDHHERTKKSNAPMPCSLTKEDFSLSSQSQGDSEDLAEISL